MVLPENFLKNKFLEAREGSSLDAEARVQAVGTGGCADRTVQARGNVGPAGPGTRFPRMD